MKVYSTLKSNKVFVPPTIASNSSFSIAPNKTYLAEILFKPLVEEFPTINLGIAIPNKQPTTIPTAFAHKGPSLTPVASYKINPLKVPIKAPNKSL